MAGLLLWGAGCIHVTSTPIAGAPSITPRQGECLVEAFRTKAPTRDYDEVARLEAAGGYGQDLEDRLRVEACALGADGVILTGEGLISGQHGTARVLRGIAVKYRPAPPAPPAKASPEI